MIDIYIPSYDRPNAPLIRKLADAGIPFTIVLDHKEDLAAYEKWNTTSATLLYIESGLGIGHIRQKIKERYRGVALMMMDDDTDLSIRDFYNPTKLIHCKTPQDVRKWYSIMDKFCSSTYFDLGSAADSVWKWNTTEHVIQNGSLCSVTIFNSWRCQEIDYDEHLYKRMEDTDFVLQAITRRFKFLICNDALRHCPMNKSAKDIGGCSEVYQNDSVMIATTSYLVNKWGKDIVKLSKTKKIGNCRDYTVDFKAMRKRYGYKY